MIKLPSADSLYTMSVKGKRKRGNDQDSPAAISSAAGAQVVVPASITSASTAAKSGGVTNGTYTVAGGRPTSEDEKIQVTFLRADVDHQWVGRISEFLSQHGRMALARRVGRIS